MPEKNETLYVELLESSDDPHQSFMDLSRTILDQGVDSEKKVEVMRRLLQAYDKVSRRYKTVIPLRKVT
ncbi:hypothetical protein [Marinococcus halophilus]|uniref:hypothetical protein n=1 Tax=Marinococcus halophilus TaxID=1371 RepID=UPI001180FEFE|nr:hypothetical protein [Marinococcus halophilus]